MRIKATAVLMKIMPKMCKKELRKLEEMTSTCTLEMDDHLENVADDIIMDKIRIQYKDTPKKKRVTPLKILYQNDVIGLINIPKILRQEEVESSLPEMDITEKPSIVYKYTSSIRVRSSTTRTPVKN